MGKVLGDAFHSTFKGLPNVIGIRSLGLAAAVELAPIAGSPGKRAYDIFLDCFHKGALVRPAGDVLVIAPPYIVEKEHIDTLVNTLADSIKTQRLVLLHLAGAGPCRRLGSRAHHTHLGAVVLRRHGWRRPGRVHLLGARRIARRAGAQRHNFGSQAGRQVLRHPQLAVHVARRRRSAPRSFPARRGVDERLRHGAVTCDLDPRHRGDLALGQHVAVALPDGLLLRLQRRSGQQRVELARRPSRCASPPAAGSRPARARPRAPLPSRPGA